MIKGITKKKAELLERNALIKNSYKDYIKMGYMKTEAIKTVAEGFKLGQATIYLALKSKSK